MWSYLTWQAVTNKHNQVVSDSDSPTWPLLLLSCFLCLFYPGKTFCFPGYRENSTAINHTFFLLFFNTKIFTNFLIKNLNFLLLLLMYSYTCNFCKNIIKFYMKSFKFYNCCLKFS